MPPERTSLDRTVTLSTRVTPKDEEEFRKFAAELDMTLSEALRSAMLTVMAFSGNRYGVRMAARGTAAAIANRVRSWFGRNPQVPAAPGP